MQDFQSVLGACTTVSSMKKGMELMDSELHCGGKLPSVGKGKMNQRENTLAY